jgi:hypothetical protein
MRKSSVHWRLSSPYGCGHKETPRKMENKHLVSPSWKCFSAPVGFGWGLISKDHCNDTHFYRFLDWNWHWGDGVFVVLLTSLRMRRKSWKDFYKTTSRNVSNIFTVHSVPVAQAICKPNLSPYNTPNMSPASSFYTHLSAYEDGTDRVFRNVGI